MIDINKEAEIKPTYTTFEQAKLLKDKRFDLPCNALFIHEIRQGNTEWELLELFDGDNTDTYEYLLSCDMDWQKNYLRPEQWQVVEWLRVNHGIWVSVRLNNTKNSWMYFLQSTTTKELTQNIKDGFDSPQEAYSAAFDYVLKELI